jgi:nucleoid-associated protein YgaU
VRSRYILEWSTSGTADKSKSRKFLIPYVSDVRLERKHAEVTTYTLGEKPVHHYAGVRSQLIEISGRSGLAPRFETIGETRRAQADNSGPALFRRFEAYIKDYENAARDAMFRNLKPPKMTLTMLFEQQKLEVEPKAFSFSRSAAASRLSYTYQISFEAHGELKFEAPAGPLSALTSAFETARVITRALNQANTTIAVVTETLEDAKSQLDTFREPLRALTRMGGEARKATRAVNALVQWPKAFMLDFWFATFELSTAVFDSWAVLPFVDRQAVRQVMLDALAPIAEAKRVTQAALGLNFITLPGQVSTFESQLGITDPSTNPEYTTRQRALLSQQATEGGYAIRNGQLVIVYEVQAGDTLQDIAGNELGDRSLWIQIAEINGMPGSDTFTDGSPLVAGSLLFVPALEGSELPGLSPDDLYGVDLQLGPDGDLVALGANPQDVATIRGVDNLVQGLTNRFVTVQGDNATFPDHGLPRLVGERSSDDTLAEASIDADLQMRRDQRIKSVQDLVINDDGDTFVIDAILEPVVGKAFSVTVPFPVA